jgi:dye decolorizing peroxidase
MRIPIAGHEPPRSVLGAPRRSITLGKAAAVAPASPSLGDLWQHPCILSLAALTLGVIIGPVLVSPAMRTLVGAVFSGPVTVVASSKRVDVKIAGGRFVPATLAIPVGATIVVQNEDPKPYTLEGAGILYGDVPVEPSSTRTVTPMGEPGAYSIVVEEDARMLLPVRVSGTSSHAVVEPDTVARALAAHRQPAIFADGHGPEYAAYTRFNLTVRGEQARDEVIDRLCEIQRTVSSPWLPAELEQYFTQSAWVRLKPTVAMVIGLGPGCYDAARFGTKVAASRPSDLHPIAYSAPLGFDAEQTQRDILVRVTSDSMWFNQQVCRYIWRQLAGRIAGRTLDCGYANPNGRSPILGGFFDGTGNPIGEERDKAVFLTGAQRGGTYLAWFRIRFDQERFEAHSLAQQQAIIGRVHTSGRQLPNDKPSSHRAKAEGDSSRTILRQGMVYDDGPEQTGLLFASLQASLTQQFEGILRGFMMNRAAPSPGTGTDRLMDYMHFEAGGYYFVPPAEEED